MRSSALDDVVTDQIDTVFGSTRKTLSRPLVEVDDAKEIATFFRGSGEWPLSDADAAMLGVDTTSAEITDTGWCREFIEVYESQLSVDVETLFRQTQTANGDYRGTPQESIAVLLITLAMSNKPVALKQDTEYVTDPAAVGRQVRTKGGLTSLQIHFGVEIIDPKTVNALVTAVIGDEPAGEGPDEWLEEIGRWVDENSATVKRTLKAVTREFDVSLDAFETTIEPALGGEELSTSDLGDETDLEAVLEAAETFAAARRLFGVDSGTALWERFTDKLDTMTTCYPNASITASMQATAENNTVPSVATVEARLRDAEEHRIDAVSAQYRRLTGDTPASDPASVCEDLTAWIQSNETAVRDVLESATTEFDGIVFDDLEDLFETVWDGEDLTEHDLTDSTIVQQAETYEHVRGLLDGDVSLWSQLLDAGQELRHEHPDSTTTEAVVTTLASSRPPTERRVRHLIKEATEPKPAGEDDDAWRRLQAVAEALRQELPNADVTDAVTGVVDADDRPSEERVTELFSDSKTVLDRIRGVKERLDELEESSIVLLDD